MSQRVVASVADVLADVAGLARRLTRRHCTERILVAEAVTLLVGTKRDPPVGFSIRRLAQRQCACIVTSKRIHLEATCLSLGFLLPLVVAGCIVVWSHSTQRVATLSLLLVCVGLLWQRRPFTIERGLADCCRIERHVVPSAVSGVTTVVRLVYGQAALDIGGLSGEAAAEVHNAIRNITIQAP